MRARRGLARRVALLLPIALAAVACGSAPATVSPATSPSPAGAPPATAGTAQASAAAATGVAAASSPNAGLKVDAGLLDVLPSRIDGVPLEPDPTTAAQIAADPTLADSAEAIAVALAIRPGTSSTGDDLAIVSVIRLRPGVFGEAWYANWRTTYDQGACDVAGGVRGEPTQVTIGGRIVYVGTCAGDAQTYHVRLADRSLIVSITAAGPRHFGELVVSGLAE